MDGADGGISAQRAAGEKRGLVTRFSWMEVEPGSAGGTMMLGHTEVRKADSGNDDTSAGLTHELWGGGIAARLRDIVLLVGSQRYKIGEMPKHLY